MRYLLALAIFLTSGLHSADSQVKISGYKDKALFDAFGRYRISEPYTLFDYKRLYGTTGVYFQSITFGTGAANTYDLTYASTTLTAGTDSGGYTIYQTRNYYTYQPGKGIRAMMSHNVMGAVTGTVKRWGYYDNSDGCFFELSGTSSTFGVVQRSSTSGSPVDTKVLQANFNLDKLDGTGPSKKTLDLTKANLFFIEQAWLGVGDSWFGVVLEGQSIYCHQFMNENTNLGPYTRTGSLPLRCEVQNWGVPAGPAYMSSIGHVLDSEGGSNPTGRQWAQSSPASTGSISDGTLRPIMSIRLKDAFKRGRLKPKYWWAVQTTNTNAKMEWWLCQGGAGMGTSQHSLTWTAVAGTRTGTEFSTSSFTLTTTTTGVICMMNDGISQQTRLGGAVVDNPFLAASADYDGNQDVLVLTYQPIGANGTLSLFGLGFEERF